MDTLQVMQARLCVRAFLDKPVGDELIREILAAARWAPSGTNTQPWQVAVLRGDTKASLTQRLLARREQHIDPNPDYAYYPDTWVDPYRRRRIACGKALYTALGIARDDKDRQKIAWENNYRFFGAPVGLIFLIDKQLNQGSWMDLGMFIQNVMLAAKALGLDTCPQASLAEYPDEVRELLGLSSEVAVVCGMALGYADMSQAVNQFRQAREPVETFTRWYD
ncbi:MAG: nitroreductase [Gammaproteobacteria bacterium]|nr:nitroreductase [Gammaproteobacteria bacterium]